MIIATDNTTVLSYLKRQGGTRSHSLLFWTQKIFQICQEIDLEFQSRHIPGRRNLLADQLSRRNQVVHSEWSLNQSVLVHLWSIWGLPQIDAFATRGSGCFKSEVGSTIPLFVSSIQPNPGGTSETTSVSKLQVHSGVSSETRSPVVSINARSIPRKRRHSVSSTISSGPVVSTPELYVTPKRAGPESSRCAAITKGLEKRGLHPSIQEFILKDTVNSTCQVYDAKWSVFEA